MNDILTFTLISLVLVVSPGPNSVLILKTVTSKGGRAGLGNILGLVSATFFHGAISILGLSAIILQSANLFMAIKLIGAAYLLYLGIKTILGTFTIKEDNENLLNPKVYKESKFHQNYIEGFLTQILNPKVSMFYLAAFPQFIDFGASNFAGAFLLVCIHASIILYWFLIFAVFIEQIKQASSNTSISLWVQRISGALLVYFSGLLAFQEVEK